MQYSHLERIANAHDIDMETVRQAAAELGKRVPPALEAALQRFPVINDANLAKIAATYNVSEKTVRDTAIRTGKMSAAAPETSAPAVPALAASAAESSPSAPPAGRTAIAAALTLPTEAQTEKERLGAYLMQKAEELLQKSNYFVKSAAHELLLSPECRAAAEQIDVMAFAKEQHLKANRESKGPMRYLSIAILLAAFGTPRTAPLGDTPAETLANQLELWIGALFAQELPQGTLRIIMENTLDHTGMYDQNSTVLARWYEDALCEKIAYLAPHMQEMMQSAGIDAQAVYDVLHARAEAAYPGSTSEGTQAHGKAFLSALQGPQDAQSILHGLPIFFMKHF